MVPGAEWRDVARMGVPVHAGVFHARCGPGHCSMAPQHSRGVLWGGRGCATLSCSSRFVLSPHCISHVCPQGESGEPGPKGQVSDGGCGSKGLPTVALGGSTGPWAAGDLPDRGSRDAQSWCMLHTGGLRKYFHRR